MGFKRTRIRKCEKKSIYFEGSFGLAFVNRFVNLIIVLSTKEALRLDKMVERYI